MSCASTRNNIPRLCDDKDSIADKNSNTLSPKVCEHLRHEITISMRRSNPAYNRIINPSDYQYLSILVTRGQWTPPTDENLEISADLLHPRDEGNKTQTSSFSLSYPKRQSSSPTLHDRERLYRVLPFEIVIQGDNRALNLGVQPTRISHFHTALLHVRKKVEIVTHLSS